MDTKEKSALDSVKNAIASVFKIIATWLAQYDLTGEDMAKLIKDIEDLIDSKITPEFAKVNTKIDQQTDLINGLSHQINGLYTALGKPAPPDQGPANS